MSERSPADISNVTTAAQETVEAYVAAWNTEDAGERLRFLDRCWAANSTWSSWTMALNGRDALARQIEHAHRHHPPARYRITLTSSVEEHGGRVSFTWALVGPDGPLLEGCEFAELDSDNRFRRVTSFFGPDRAHALDA